ncbi:MAG: pyridoxal phosphate-dependent aminotransferase [Clostridia bacterium]
MGTGERFMKIGPQNVDPVSESSEAHGGRVHEVARLRHVPPHAILDASASINPLGPPPSVLGALSDLPGLLRHYPDSTHEPVRQVLSTALGVPRGHIWCGNGATEVLDHIMYTLRPRRVFILEPAFSEYGRVAARHGLPVERVCMKPPFLYPGDHLDARLADGDLLVFNNPHNPSGRAYPRSEWEPLFRRWTDRGVHILVDEAFMDFLPDAGRFTALPLAISVDGVTVVRSATKIFALPGLRFGAGVGSVSLVHAITALRDPWSVNQLAQAAIVAAYGDKAFLRETWHWAERARTWAADTWGAHPRLHTYPPSANFMLVRWPTVPLASHAAHALWERRVLVRQLHGSRGLGAQWMRIALRTPEENARIWQIAAEVLGRP